MIIIIAGNLDEAPILQVSMDFLMLSPTPTRFYIAAMPLQTTLHENNREGAFPLINYRRIHISLIQPELNV